MKLLSRPVVCTNFQGLETNTFFSASAFDQGHSIKYSCTDSTDWALLVLESSRNKQGCPEENLGLGRLSRRALRASSLLVREATVGRRTTDLFHCLQGSNGSPRLPSRCLFAVELLGLHQDAAGLPLIQMLELSHAKLFAWAPEPNQQRAYAHREPSSVNTEHAQ